MRRNTKSRASPNETDAMHGASPSGHRKQRLGQDGGRAKGAVTPMSFSTATLIAATLGVNGRQPARQGPRVQRPEIAPPQREAALLIATLLPRHLGHDTVKHHLVKAVWNEAHVTAVVVNRRVAAGTILRVLKVALGAAQCTSCCVKVEAPAPANLTRLASL
eukprot:scaffold34809_cov69-Phaeocystis_antarctica.AAC.6